MRRLLEISSALTRRIASYRKSAWELEDYPIRFVRRDLQSATQATRFKELPWSAQIINWWQMAGHGDTRDEALSNLRQNLANYRSTHAALPRPGTGAPIEFAATDLMDQHQELACDFMSRIFGLNLDECFVSDESSLWDFNSDETNDACHKKIILLYGVDVSDVEGANVSEILSRIAAHRRAG